jgi:5-hydroxyisourate hydrolase
MSAISTHILDAVRGKPAVGVAIQLEQKIDGLWTVVGTGETDHDGRCHDLASELGAGIYRLIFAVGSYFAHHDRRSLYPEISIAFSVDGSQRYHIPLLLSDNSYTTYRGS